MEGRAEDVAGPGSEGEEGSEREEGSEGEEGGAGAGVAGRTWYVVGGGPTGLTCAQLLAESGERVVVLEAQPRLGGCHAVHRVDGLFTEHGPRVCVENYATFRDTLRRFADFDALFVPYRASFVDSAWRLLGHLALSEIGCFASAFARLLLFGGVPDETVGAWMARCGFGDEARARVDLLCATVDGAGADRLTLFELLDVVNQNMGYGIRQPRRANDVALFAQWRARLEGAPLACDVRTGERVRAVECAGGGGGGDGGGGDGGPTALVTSRRRIALRADDEVVVAMPPRQAERLLPADARVRALARESSYDTYLPITFHWRRPVPSPGGWGGGRLTPWGVLYVVLSDYLEGERSGTIVQAAIAFADAPSPHTGRTAHETGDAAALADEAWRQLGLAMPRFDRAVLSPRVARRAGRWHNEDTAFLRTASTPARAPSALRPRLHFVGPHTGDAWYSATALEAACASAVAFVNAAVPRSRAIQTPRRAMDLRTLLAILAVVVAVVGWLLLASSPSSPSSPCPPPPSPSRP